MLLVGIKIFLTRTIWNFGSRVVSFLNIVRVNPVACYIESQIAVSIVAQNSHLSLAIVTCAIESSHWHVPRIHGSLTRVI